MTELYINGQSIDLPLGFSHTVTEENPCFGKRGQYTLDIEISMNSPVNARVFKHYNRTNNIEPIAEDMKAILLIDNKVWLKGTVIILEPSTAALKIQLVSGNSELNYIAGANKNIRLLNLGFDTKYSTPETMQWSFSDLNSGYPANNALILPFLNSENDDMGNRFHIAVNGSRFSLVYSYDGSNIFKNAAGAISTYANLRPQPFLCFLIERIIACMGYELTENKIAEDSVLRNAYLVHGYDTIEWAKMLPNWTVSEFLTQMENLFDCTFIVNNISNQVAIKFNHSAIDSKVQEIEVSEVFNKEIDRSTHVTHKSSNVGFALDDNDYYKYSVIDKKIKAAAEIYQMTDESNLQLLLESLCDMDGLTDNKFNCIFRTMIGDFIAFNNGTKVIPKEIDFLCPAYNNPEGTTDLDIELKVIPAPFKVLQLPIYASGINPATTTSKFHMQLPIAEHADPFLFNGATGFPNYNIQNLIDGTDSIKNEYLSDKMRIALYNGRKPVRAFTSNGTVISTSLIDSFPVSFVKSLAEYYCDLNTRDLFLANGAKPLSPKGLFEKIYSLDKKVSENEIFKFSFLENTTVDIQSIFLINNRKYLCSRIERQVTNDGIKNPSIGYFFSFEQ